MLILELPFALALDNDPDVKMFFKIPDRFKLDTPIGSYNPDWAVYLTKNGEEKLYFILETNTLFAQLPESYDEDSITSYRRELYEYFYMRYKEIA